MKKKNSTARLMGRYMLNYMLGITLGMIIIISTNLKPIILDLLFVVVALWTLLLVKVRNSIISKERRTINAYESMCLLNSIIIISTGLVIVIASATMRFIIGVFYSTTIAVLLIIFGVCVPLLTAHNEWKETRVSNYGMNVVKCPICGNYVELNGDKGGILKCPNCGRTLKIR